MSAEIAASFFGAYPFLMRSPQSWKADAARGRSIDFVHRGFIVSAPVIQMNGMNVNHWYVPCAGSTHTPYCFDVVNFSAAFTSSRQFRGGATPAALRMSLR